MVHVLDHPNIIRLKHYFFSTTERDELYLNLVLEFCSRDSEQNCKAVQPNELTDAPHLC
jgi:hypothetical protein